MKNLKKTASVILVIIATSVIATFLLLKHYGPSEQTISLADGTKLRFLGTAVGRNSYYRSTFWNVVNRLPAPAYKQVIKLAGEPPFPNSGHPIQSTLTIWLEISSPLNDGPTPFSAMLRVPGGRLSGHGTHVDLSLHRGETNSVDYIQFEFWPRHAEIIECVLLQGDLNQSEVVGSFQFENPSHVPAPAWTPDPIPATKAVGDLKVTLLNFSTRSRTNMTDRDRPFYRVYEDGAELSFPGAVSSEEKRSLVKLAFDSPGGTNETWTTYRAELSDGVGNNVDALLHSSTATNLVLSPVLWPDETAWKLKLHIKKTSEFGPDELLTISNIPLPSVGLTNNFSFTNKTMGVQTVFKQFARKPPDGGRSWFRLEHHHLGGTNQIDMLSVTAHPESTNTIPWGSRWFNSGSIFYLKSVPTNATHMDFVFSIQKARFVEFTVAPNWVTNDYVIKGR